MTNNRLENLPNELLIEIFAYTDIRDLFHGFRGLNQRIDHLLRINFNLSYNLERIELELIDFFTNRITHLIVNTWQEIDLRLFPSVKSLIFYQMTSNQCQQIRSEYLPNLVHLSTSAVPGSIPVPQLAQDILSNGIPSLRSIDLSLVELPHFSWSFRCPSLSFISIHTSKPFIIFLVLHSARNLKSFHIHFQMETMAIFAPTPTVIDHPLKEFLLADPYHRLPYNHIHTLLQYMPHLRRIHLNFRSRIPFIRFARNLINRLPELQQFHCLIDDTSDDQSTSIETIQQIHPCFHRLRCPTAEPQFRTFISP